MTRLKSVFAAGWLLAASSIPSLALDFSVHPSDNPTENAISASGKIEADDAFKLQTYLAKLSPRATTSIYLNSSGGDVAGSIELGLVISKVKIRTYVVGDKVRCSSACTTVFIAGRDRATDLPFRVKASDIPLKFHNFTPRLEDKAYKASDAMAMEARAQKTILKLAVYMEEVGSSIEY
jgi:hypothetical protein